MATPKWFDANAYMQNKLAQLKAQEPDAGWTLDKVYDTFRDAGFVGTEGQYEHFVQYGAAEEVAPNAYFDADEYYAAKAKQYYEEELKQEFTGSEEQIAYVKSLIKDADMNAWTHYQQFGSAEGVNPSNAFDASDYCAAKAEAMNKAGQKAPDGTEWTAEKIAEAIDQAGMSVLEHYLTYAGTGEGEVAAGSTYPVADDEQVSKPGETFVLKAGIEQLQGTSGDDVFKAEGGVMDAGDVTDGGAGNDTLEVYDNSELKGTFTNIENLVVAGADVSTSGYDLSSFSKSFTLKAEQDAAVSHVTNQTLVMDGVGNKTLTATMDAAQTSVKLVNEGSTGATFKAEGDKLASMDLTTNANTTLADGDGNTVKNVAITALADATITLTGLDVLENVTVAGDGSVKLTGATKADINATDSTGGVTVDSALDNTAAFTGGAGNDTITLGASTQAHDMGAGDDTVELNGNALGTDGSVDGGDGVDTLVMFADNAAAMTANNFKAFTNFEVLGLNGGTGTIQLDSFGDINQVTIAKALSGEVTIENMDSNGTLEFNAAAGQKITVNVTDAGEEGHITDVLNVKLSAAESIENAGKELVVNDVETINIEADDADDDGDAAHTLQLTADAAKTVKVTGDADLALSGTFAAGATIDISTNTADVTFTANTIDSSTVTDENTLVTLKGFTDGDTIKIGGGTQDDVFGAKMELGTNWDIQDCLENAVKQGGKAAWFEFGDNTYILFSADESLGTDDVIVKLAGTDYNLEGLNLNDGTLTLGA